jgi:ABC-type sugar transport system substrate-binding protein
VTKLLRALLLGSCSLLATCGGRALLQDASGRYRLLARCAGDEAGQARCRDLVRRAGSPAVVFSHDERLARALASPATTDGALPADVRIVTIGTSGPEQMFAAAATPAGRQFAAQAAVVLDETGAGVAVDLALLWCHGITPPRRLTIGTHILRAGQPDTTQPAPGDFVVELLRRQHGDLLTDKPGTDVVFRIGCALWRGEGRHLRVRDQVRAAAGRYPQLELTDGTADGDPARLDAIVRAFLAEGHRAVLISTDDPSTLTSVATEAREHNVALFVLDAAADCEVATCCIGCDQQVLGRAAGEAVKLLAPNGAAIVELGGDRQRPAIQARERGFATALGLQ